MHEPTGHLGILLYQLLHKLLLVKRISKAKCNQFSNLLSLEQHLLWAEVEKNEKGHLIEGTSWRPIKFDETNELILLAQVYTYFKNDASCGLTTNSHIEKHFWPSHCRTCEATKCEKNTPQICTSNRNNLWRGRGSTARGKNQKPWKERRPTRRNTEVACFYWSRGQCLSLRRKNNGKSIWCTKHKSITSALQGKYCYEFPRASKSSIDCSLDKLVEKGNWKRRTDLATWRHFDISTDQYQSSSDSVDCEHWLIRRVKRIGQNTRTRTRRGGHATRGEYRSMGIEKYTCVASKT